MMDILAVPGEEIPGLLVSNFEVLKKRLPEKPDLDFIGERYREAATVARLFWEHPPIRNSCAICTASRCRR